MPFFAWNCHQWTCFSIFPTLHIGDYEGWFLIFLGWRSCKCLYFSFLTSIISHSLDILLHIKKFCKLLWHVQFSKLCEFLMWTTCTYSHLLHLLYHRDSNQNSLQLLDKFEWINWLSPWNHQKTKGFLMISGGLARVDNLLYISINAWIKYLFHHAPLNELIKNKTFIST